MFNWLDRQSRNIRINMATRNTLRIKDLNRLDMIRLNNQALFILDLKQLVINPVTLNAHAGYIRLVSDLL